MKLGSKVILITETSSITEPEFAEEVNTVGAVSYLHPTYKEHKTQLLNKALLPKREVEDYEIHHVDRRYF